ncbi:MAG: type II secretion system protein [Gammaproteobacteria bacterium]|nr:type II secretion system protein [Gammaproteobacteria bacterium]
MSLSSNKFNGFSLIEMVATLAIVSILAAMAMPYAKMGIIRNQEFELQRSLREIRNALDEFHRDWKNERHNKLEQTASRNGYPVSLQVLVDGVPLAGQISGRKKYLRRIPRDPFTDQSLPVTQHWQLIGYKDDPDTDTWNGEDIYDVRSKSSRQALNKSYYRDW